MNNLIETEFIKCKEQASKIQNEMELISDATLVNRYNYFDKLQKLQSLYNKMQ
jgi:hypothetical protein